MILRRQNSGRIKTFRTQMLSDSELEHVFAYFEEQIFDIGDMDRVAALINMDVFRFTRAFRATTGQTPRQFLIDRRLARVKELLLRTDNTLADIANAVGFASQSHMTVTFTKHMGVSPGKWRKAMASDLSAHTSLSVIEQSLCILHLW